METNDDRLLYRPAEAFRLTGVSRSQGYALIASREWPSIRIGKAIRIPAELLRAWIDRKLKASQIDCVSAPNTNQIDRVSEPNTNRTLKEGKSCDG